MRVLSTVLAPSKTWMRVDESWCRQEFERTRLLVTTLYESTPSQTKLDRVCMRVVLTLLALHIRYSQLYLPPP